jgi:hypothetical protein
LFTYEEWEGYEYALDIAFSAGTGFGSPVGRAIGVGKTVLGMQHEAKLTMSQGTFRRFLHVCSIM